MIGWFVSAHFIFGSSYVFPVVLSSTGFCFLLHSNLLFLFAFLFFGTVRWSMLRVIKNMWNVLVCVRATLRHTWISSSTSRVVLKYELEFYQRSLSDLSRRPLRGSVILRSRIIASVHIFVVAGISSVHCLCNVARMCGNLKTQCNHDGGCCPVRKDRTFCLPIFFSGARLNICNNNFNYLLCELYIALFVATRFHFAQTSSPVRFYAYICWPLVLNCILVVTLSAFIRSCPFCGPFDTIWKRFCIRLWKSSFFTYQPKTVWLNESYQ